MGVRSRIKENFGALALASQMLLNQLRDQEMILDGEKRTYAMIVYLTPMLPPDAKKYMDAMKEMNTSPPDGTEARFTLANPRPHRVMMQYAEVECAQPAQAVQIAMAFASTALNKAGVKIDEMRVEAVPLEAQDNLGQFDGEVA
jgi:hypothetical protein